MSQWQQSGPLHLMEMMELVGQQQQAQERDRKAEREADAAVACALGTRDGFTPTQQVFRNAFASVRKTPYCSKRGFGFSIDTSGRKPDNM